MSKNDWLNTTRVINPDMEKPCVKLDYCPYCGLVECYPFSGQQEHNRYSKLSCADINGSIIQFGHDCPCHYLAEFVEKPKPKVAVKSIKRTPVKVASKPVKDEEDDPYNLKAFDFD